MMQQVQTIQMLSGSPIRMNRCKFHIRSLENRTPEYRRGGFPGKSKKCSDARSTTVVRNVRTGTNRLSESWNLFGQVELRNYQGAPPAPPSWRYVPPTPPKCTDSNGDLLTYIRGPSDNQGTSQESVSSGVAEGRSAHCNNPLVMPREVHRGPTTAHLG